MEQDLMRELEAKCIQEQPPECVAACPVHVDARKMAAAVAKGDFDAALAVYAKAVAFPSVISRICDAPCQTACKRREAGDPIRIRNLERACVEHGTRQQRSVFLRKRDKEVAVVGGGLSGLSAAAELGRKGYQVTLYEKSDRPGGSLLALPPEKLPPELLETDLKVLEPLPVTIRLNEPVGCDGVPLSDITERYDAVYVAAGSAEGFEELGETDETTLATRIEKVFAGGRMRLKNCSPIAAVGDGRRAAISIDRFLQGVSLASGREREGAFKTELYTDTERIEPLAAVSPSGPDGAYTKEEAQKEAQRCIQCQCLECVKGCAFLAHYKSYPKRYVREVYNNLTIVMGMRHGNEMINSCSLCGQCAAICPNGLNMGEVFLQARREMVRTKKMPPSAHDFALRDLAHSNSDAYFLARNQTGHEKSRHVFFPGCQLGASAPGLVKRAYADLSSRLAGGVGLMLGCCGVIADWAGRERLFEETVEKLTGAWASLGEPEVIAACPTCFTVFKAHYPRMRVRGIWDVLSKTGLPENFVDGKGRVLAVQDACTTRHAPDVQDGVRRLAEKMGYTLEEPRYAQEITQCCGYGGLTSYANPNVGREMAARCAGQSGSDYLTYCINCRDSILREDSRAVHLLELVYPADSAKETGVAGYSLRRENREGLRAQLLREIWGEEALESGYAVSVTLDEQVEKDVEERMILKEDIARAVAAAEESGNKILDKATGRFVASNKSGAVTYWVWYTPENGGFRVHRAYSHRMDIEV